MTWKTVALGMLTDKIGSGATPRGGSASYNKAGIPFIRSMNVHDGSFNPDGLVFLDETQARALDHVTLCEHDVLLNITGASVARVCRLPLQYAGGRVNQHVAIIRPQLDRLLPEYLEHLLISPQVKQRLLAIAGAGATREAITKSAIQKFEVPLPPLEEQRRISLILDKANDVRSRRRESLDGLRRLVPAAFMSRFEVDRTSKVARFDYVADLKRGPFGGALKKEIFVRDGFKVYEQSHAIQKDYRVGTYYVDLAKYHEMQGFAVLPGDLIVSCSGTLGKTYLVPDCAPPGIINQALLRVRPNLDFVLPEYLLWFLEFGSGTTGADWVLERNRLTKLSSNVRS